MAVIPGDDGNNILTGGAVGVTPTDDTLNGFLGNDTYRFTQLSGRDEVNDTGGNDQLRFDSTVPRGTIRIVRSNFDYDDLIVAVVDNLGNILTEITLNDHYLFGRAIESILLDNGSRINLTGGLEIQGWNGQTTVRGTDFNDTITSRAVNETLLGGTGDDTYLLRANSGNDILYDDGGTDTLRFDASVARTSLRMVRSGNDFDDLILAVVDADGNAISEFVLDQHFVVGNRFESATFINNLVLSLTGGLRIQGWDGASAVRGTDLADTVVSNANSEILRGGLGNDSYLLSATSGNDTIFDDGGNDRLRFDGSVTPGTLRMMRAGNDLDDLILAVVDDNGNAVSVITLDQHFNTGNRLEGVIFSNGAQLNLTGGLTVQGWGNSTVLRGTDLSDVLISNANSELLLGGTGNDTYRLTATSGNDTITDEGGTDRIAFDASVARGNIRMTRAGSDQDDLILAVVDANGNALTEIVLDEHFRPGNRMESILFSDGSQMNLTGGLTLQGWGNNTVLRGTDLNDVLISNANNEILEGNTGNDTYRLSANSGNDTIYDAGGTDRILFDSSAPSGQLRMMRSGNDFDDLILAVVDANGNALAQITLDEHFVVGNRIESVTFSNGGQLNLTGGLRVQGWGEVSVVRGTQFDDNVVSSRRNETLAGGEGEDTFIFNPVPSAATDVIADFEQGGDTIRFSAAFGLADIDDLIFTQNSGSVTIRAGNQIIHVLDAVISDFDSTDFLFA